MSIEDFRAAAYAANAAAGHVGGYLETGATYLARPTAPRRQRCQGYGQVATDIIRRDRSGSRWATAICPVCGKKVPATRPLKRDPSRASYIGSH